MRLGFEGVGGTCVYSVEWDKFARQTYTTNFAEPEGCDIRDVHHLPPHDILVAGFPCQPFSLAGVSKKTSLGRAHGFLDAVQGTLFFEVARLADTSRSPVVFLENVKHLLNHDSGRTFRTITGTLRELGYTLTWSLVDASAWVPQRRERVFIVGTRTGGSWPEFEFPQIPTSRPNLDSILERNVDDSYRKSERVWAYLQEYAARHRARGNGFGFGLVGPGDVARTLSARYFKDGSEILVRMPEGPPRMLTPRECARLMGFPESFKIPVSRTQAYRQFGNAVVVPVVRHLARALVEQRMLQAGDRPVPKRARPGRQLRLGLAGT
jgi:DNA (cytosine-5)-methyltransferase 1